MTCSQVLFFPLSLLRGWLQIASWNQAPSLHTGRPKQTPELMEALENVVSRSALSAPCTRRGRRFGPCASFQHHQYWPFLSLMRKDSGRQEGQERRFVLCSCFVSQAEKRDTQGSLVGLFTLTLLENRSAGQEGFTAFCTLGRGFATRQRRGYVENQLLFGFFFLLSLQIKPWVLSNGKFRVHCSEITINRTWSLWTEMSAPSYTAHAQRSKLGL